VALAYRAGAVFEALTLFRRWLTVRVRSVAAEA
jgi:hypothetical protein